jgi:heme exporter protein D
MKMAEFFEMGGYAAFIWPAYIAAILLMVGLLVVSLRSMRQREALVQSLRSSRRAEAKKTTETQS